VGELEREGRRIVRAGQELVDQGIERKTAPGGPGAAGLLLRATAAVCGNAHGFLQERNYPGSALITVFARQGSKPSA
jgi:hypothetical protein